jgi:hypothetical protein
MTNSVLQTTDYSSLSVQISSLLGRPLPGGYSACVVSLLQTMQQQFPALTQERNPVIANLARWTPSELAFIIQEYSGFSNAAIHMFLEARIRNHWPALTKEIIRNMEEEMGTLTNGIPHLELMRYGYRVELGLETDSLRHTAITEGFIDRMSALFRERDNARLAGVLLAFETTAVDEFHIVQRMLHRYKELIGAEITPDSLTGRYIAGHVVPETPDPADDPEMDHYLGMVKAVEANVADKDLQSLVQGFLSVCLELNCWWELLAFEALHKEIRSQLERRVESRDLYADLLQACSHGTQ